MSDRRVVFKKQSSDFWEEGPVTHQDILKAEVVGTADRDLLALPSGFYPTNGAALVKLRLWAAGAASDAAAGELVRFRAYTFPAPGRSPSAIGPTDTDQQKEQGAGQLVADYTVVCSGNVIADKHPVTGAATPGIRWYEMNEVNAIHYLLDSASFEQIPDATLGSSYIGITPVDEIQTITLTASGTADWTCSFRGETTASIAYDATGAEVATALAALSTVGSGNVGGAGSAGGPFVLTFTKDLGGANVPMIVIVDDGGHTSIVPVETTPGVSGRLIAFKWDVLASLGLHVDIVSMDNTGNATRCVVAIDSVM